MRVVAVLVEEEAVLVAVGVCGRRSGQIVDKWLLFREGFDLKLN